MGELTKLLNMKMTMIPIVIGALGTVTKVLVQEPGGYGNNRMSQDHPHQRVIEISQNTEKSPGDMLSLNLQ